ncbi:MAG TPA: helix-turn-helix domain-containing protein [Candidatus Dormibacteraeota bacterium]|jgi:transcriptional regulator with XRE-family HTH domain
MADTLGQRIRRLRVARGLTQGALGDFAGRSDRWIRMLEAGQGGAVLDHQTAARIAVGLRIDVAVVLGLAPVPANLGGGDELTALAAMELDPDDVPALADVEESVLRLRRSYSTTPPDELQRRVDVRLRQVRRLLVGEQRGPTRRTLLEAAAWLALLRGTVQADQRQYEAAATSVRSARELARELGHGDLVAWTWETGAWMAATDGRQHDARDLASAGVEIAPVGGYGLVAVTMQRARINGALGDDEAALRDLQAGARALAAVEESEWVDDHYVVDRAKAAYFASGTMAQLRRPAETIEHAAEVVRANDDPQTRNWWPMRTSNARLEWAAALADQGEEDGARELARNALDPRWFRPDTERRTRLLLTRMRDPRLRAEVIGQMQEAKASSLIALEEFDPLP